MSEMLEYKGYFGTVEYSAEDETLFGRIAFIKALVSYEGQTVRELKNAFEEAVDDYLDLCGQAGKKPEQPCKGVFNVRTGPELHRKATLYASRHHMNLNQVVKEALERFLAAS